MENEINKKIIIEVEAETDQLKKNVTDLNQTLDSLLQKQKQLTDTGQQNTKAFQDIATQVKVAQTAIDNHSKAIDDNVKAQKSATGSLAENKDAMTALLQQYDTLSRAQGDNSKQAKDLNIQIGTLSNTIEEQEKKLKKSRQVFDVHKGTMNALSSSFDKLKGVSGTFGPSLEEAAKGFEALKSGLSVVKTGFTSVGEAIKTTGFGLLVLVLQSVIDYFTKTADGSKVLKGAISAVGKVVEIIHQGFAALGKIIVNAVTHPVDSIKNLANIIKENIINRFEAFSVILDGIIHLDFKKVGDGVIQAFTGVTHATDKIASTFNAVKKGITEIGTEVKDAYTKGYNTANKAVETHKQKLKGLTAAQKEAVDKQKQQIAEINEVTEKANNERIESAQRLAESSKKTLSQELAAVNQHYEQLGAKYHQFVDKYKNMTAEQQQAFSKLSKGEQEAIHAGIKASNAAIQQLNVEHRDTLIKINEKYAKESAEQTLEEHRKLNQQLQKEDEDLISGASKPEEKLGAEKKLITDKYAFEIEAAQNNAAQIENIQKNLQKDLKKLDTDNEKTIKAAKDAQRKKDKEEIEKDSKEIAATAISFALNSIKQASDAKVAALEKDKASELSNTSLTSAQKLAINQKYKKEEDKIKAKAFKEQQEISIMQALINGAIAITKAPADLGPVAGAIAIAAIIASTAAQVASIAKQKPPMAKGGYFQSDGKGALLSGYSRTDDTNAYLRSGEAVVVSEAMQVPWARNLVSAINVGFGGRDFSLPGTSRGYAVGGIFTDGGDANRYYNQPVNDQKNLANTIAYQMINNFPPVYVDVKDVNNQQNILAQTINRVNL